MDPIFPKRIPIAHLPTPIEKATRLSEFLNGPQIYIKRDDQTGLAFGGNKTRKLEFLAADAMAYKTDVLITCGSPQSNHCRQTAAVAAKLGLDCHLVLSGFPPAKLEGNTFLDMLLGATIHWSGDANREDLMMDIAKELQDQGQRLYTIKLGGSNALGAVGYVWAIKELSIQLANTALNFDAIVVASSSGGTQAGMIVGKKIYEVPAKIFGISIEHPRAHLEDLVYRIAKNSASLLGIDDSGLDKLIEIDGDYLGKGYGMVGNLEREAIQLLARREAILLDPVYTARAMGALIDRIRRKSWGKGQKILFWHTGGTPALFPYNNDLSRTEV